MKFRYIIAGAVFLLLVFAVRVCWDRSMPDDGEVVCSFKGTAYVVANGLTGVFLRRREALDEECWRRMKQ